jgi:alkylation response protein AidB-like acyl-CoA dehydrogenase
MKGSAIEDTIDRVKKLASERLTPRAHEADKSRSFPKENLRALAEAGFMGLIISEEDTGSGAGRDGFASVVTEISKACASTALIYVSHSIVAKAIELFGSPLIKEKWLNGMPEGKKLGAFAVHEPDSGSDSGAITTKARPNGNHYIVIG